jgi:asparagine synthase (glutamine-hydrolysing)
MCGIAGIFNFSNSPIEGLGAAANMAKSMAHRGPNAEGYFIGYKSGNSGKYYPAVDGSFFSQKGDIFLAHRRLSIIDLSNGGAQPMSCDNKRYWITYNGELYNYRELMEELRQEGVQFNSKSDTEVLLKAYCHWGHKALNKFNGMFAFVIWDDHEKTLFCARDRVGIKPLYYTIQNNQFIFASDINTLIASKLYQPEVNIEGLYHTMSYGVSPRPMTCFKNIFALPQGHWATINRDGDFKINRYWQIPINTQDPNMTEAQAADLLEQTLTKSVQRRLVADVPVGTFMSGGVDSTLISALAAKSHPGIQAFTLGYEDYAEEFNEIEQAKATAALYPLQHTIETISMKRILDNVENNIHVYDEPFFSLSPNYLISKLVSEHGLTVVLNGLGGDELFAGYRHSRWANRGPLFRLVAPFIKPLKGKSELFARVSEFSKAKSIDRYYSYLFTIMSENMKQNLFQPNQVENFNTIESLHNLYVGKDIRFTDNIEAMCYMDLIHYIGNHHVYRIDQFTMHFSLEGRFPFLDHEVIEAAFRIPSKYKIKDGLQKYILRKVAQKYIAPECLSMKKKGFSLPMDYWLRNDLSSYAKGQLDKLSKNDLFSESMVKQIWPKFEAQKLQSRHVWQLVALQTWFERYFSY